MMSTLVHPERDVERGSLTTSSTRVVPSTFRSFSPSRRMFCLLAGFDFLLTLLIWVLYAHAFSNGLKQAIKKEVSNYHFGTSLFDIVVLAIWRMILLLLAYALFHSQKWYVIALTTTVTTAYLLAKVFEFDFSKSLSQPMDYVLVIESLVMCWVETWALDFKVLPSERKAEQRLLAESLASTAGERRPLLGGEPHHGYMTPSWFSERTFYTPEGSVQGSDNESDTEAQPVVTRLSLQDREFIQKGMETMETTWGLMGLEEGWKSEKVKDGIRVESRVLPSRKKIYRLKDSLDARAEDVFNLIVMHPENASKWGGNITYSCVLRQIDDKTDIVYNSTGDVGGGMVASRDFVNLRRWEKRGDVFVSCNVAVNCDDMPPKKEHVRGENGPGGWAIREAEGNPSRTEYVWLFDIDLKGWLPQSVIDTAMAFMLFSTGCGLRVYVQENLGKTNPGGEGPSHWGADGQIPGHI